MWEKTIGDAEVKYVHGREIFGYIYILLIAQSPT